jgi:hypothetical protein
MAAAAAAATLEAKVHPMIAEKDSPHTVHCHAGFLELELLLLFPNSTSHYTRNAHRSSAQDAPPPPPPSAHSFGPMGLPPPPGAPLRTSSAMHMNVSPPPHQHNSLLPSPPRTTPSTAMQTREPAHLLGHAHECGLLTPQTRTEHADLLQKSAKTSGLWVQTALKPTNPTPPPATPTLPGSRSPPLPCT